MSIITLIVVVCLIVLAFWGNNTYISPGILRIIINIVLIILVLVMILDLMGIGHLGNVRV